MAETSQFNRQNESHYRPQTIMELFDRAWPLVWVQIPKEERMIYLRTLAEDHLRELLSDLSREERAALMNSLLPTIAQEFPLADLDFLSAFPIPQNEYRESQDDAKKK